MATIVAIKALTFEDRQKHAEVYMAEVGQGICKDTFTHDGFRLR